MGDISEINEFDCPEEGCTEEQSAPEWLRHDVLPVHYREIMVTSDTPTMWVDNNTTDATRAYFYSKMSATYGTV